MTKLTSPKIYILDDDLEMLSLLTDMLEDIDLESVCFSHAQTLFEKVTNFTSESILVLDLNMPDMDGIEVMRRLASFEVSPALILISGHDTGVLYAAEKLGIAHQLKILCSLSKPIHLGNFQNLIRKYTNTIRPLNNLSSTKTESIISAEELLFAIENDQMVLYYQPQILIKNRQILSCEALIRWNHPERGLIFPDEFIAMTEINGWMPLLTELVIQKAVKQIQDWKKLDCQLPIAINISADDITSLILPEKISELLTSNKLDPNLLTLEVTESALMGELVTSLDILTRLRLKGIGLSIDDFGTGYSSLSQLHKIPFSELKIDQSFVMSMTDDAEAKAIVKTCIMLGHELNMSVVAEGVETKEHLEILEQLGCDIAQGYFFSKAVPAKEMTQLLLKE